jgi:hypothetical protein
METGVLEQGRLPDPSLSAHYQRPALSPSDGIYECVEQRALGGPTPQVGCRRGAARRVSMVDNKPHERTPET